MKRCFGLNYVNYSGEELEKALGKGVPNYYLRYRNRVFGCKDVQMAAKKKLSGDCETIKNNFWEVCHKFQGACNSYIEYKEEFELNQVFPFNKYIFQEARKVGYELEKIRWFDEVFENLEILDRKRQWWVGLVQRKNMVHHSFLQFKLYLWLVK